MPAWFNMIYLVPILLLTPLVAAALARATSHLIRSPRQTNGEDAAFGATVSLAVLLIVTAKSANSYDISSWSEFYQAVLIWDFGGVIATPVIMIGAKIARIAFKAVVAGVDHVCAPR